MKRLLILGVASTLVFLCIYAPAQLLGNLLIHLSNGRLSLAATQGSIWQGNASVLLSSAYGKDHADDALQVNLGKVAWDTQPLQLLAGKFSVSLSWNNGAPFWVTLDTSRLRVENAAFNLPSDIVPALVPALKSAQLGGQLAVRCDNISLTRNEVLGQLNVDWNQASSPLSMVNPLGNYYTRLDGRGSVLDIKLETQGDSPLLLQGNGRWTASEGLHFEGVAEANAASRMQLQELLRVMGNETSAGSGRYRLRF